MIFLEDVRCILEKYLYSIDNSCDLDELTSLKLKMADEFLDLYRTALNDKFKKEENE